MMDNLEIIKRRYMNEPIFHNLVEMLVTGMLKGLLDRDDVIDALRFAERVMYERQRDQEAQRLLDIAMHE
jgi:hypothetical protein